MKWFNILALTCAIVLAISASAHGRGGRTDRYDTGYSNNYNSGYDRHRGFLERIRDRLSRFRNHRNSYGGQNYGRQSYGGNSYDHKSYGKQSYGYKKQSSYSKPKYQSNY